MKVVLLPPGVVWFLNSLYHGTDTSESLDAFRLDRAGAADWMTREGAYSSNELETSQLETLKFLWSQIDHLAESPDQHSELSRFAPLVFEAAELMQRLEDSRNAGVYSPLPAVNRLLLVGAAYLQGRAAGETLADYLSLAKDYHRYIAGMYRLWKLDTPKEQQKHIELGLNKLKSGVERAAEALYVGNNDEVEQSLAIAKAGSELVQFLLDRQSAQERLTNDENRSCKVPLVGPDLEAQIKAARQVARGQWKDAVEITLDNLIPRLEQYWYTTQPTLLIPQPYKDELSTGVEDAMVELRFVYQNALSNDYTSEDVVESLADATQELSDMFEKISQRSLSFESCVGKTEELYFKMCQGIMAGDVPDLSLANLLSEHSPAGGHRFFRGYLQDGNTDHLVKGLEELLQAKSASSFESTKDDWKDSII